MSRPRKVSEGAADPPRPILLGLHNPLSADPDRALWPDPPGCSGWRLWQMSGLDREVWLAAYRRMNLMDGREWDKDAAEAKFPEVLEAIRAAPVTVVLGHQVRKFLELPQAEWILPQYEEFRGFWWRFLPHPSGRTQTYNDPIFRAATRLLLQELIDK